jgi:hypothetical protein
VAQFHSVTWGMSMLACCLLMGVEAENCREYEEAAANTKHMHSLKDLLKRNHGKVVAPRTNYMDLKLNMGMYCGLLWAIFGDHCDYYKELLKIYRILDREECFTIQNAYTREVCARITWAIVDNGQSFFGWNPMALDIAPGATFLFSTLHLECITDSVCNTIPIQRAMFPCEWMSQATTVVPYGGAPPGPTPIQWATPAPAPSHTAPTTPTQMKEDIRHPKIKFLMDPYLKKYNNFVSLSDILTSLGKQLTDLSTLPKYCHPTCQCSYVGIEC